MQSRSVQWTPAHQCFGMILILPRIGLRVPVLPSGSSESHSPMMSLLLDLAWRRMANYFEQPFPQTNRLLFQTNCYEALVKCFAFGSNMEKNVRI